MFASFNARAVGLKLSAAETIELAAQAGFAGVDLLVRDLLDFGEDPRGLRALMDDRGLRGGAFPKPVQWRHDAATFQHDLARLPRLAEAAAQLGLRRTATWVLPETPTATGPGADRAAVVQMHVDLLGALARTLEPFDIRLGLEVIGVASFRTGRGLPFITRFTDLGPLLDSIRRAAPNVGVVVDGWHLYAAGESAEAGLAWGVDSIVWTHVADLPAGATRDPAAMNDNDRGMPGENGAIDCKTLLQCLASAGYDGPVTAEPMPGCRTLADRNQPEAIAHQVAHALRSVWPPTQWWGAPDRTA
jgi:sugar phosphate isomerase/epimerase